MFEKALLYAMHTMYPVFSIQTIYENRQWWNYTKWMYVNVCVCNGAYFIGTIGAVKTHNVSISGYHLAQNESF